MLDFDINALQGHFLLAMPNMGDSRFSRAVIYIFAHDGDGAMGFVVNYRADNITLGAIIENLPDAIKNSGLVNLPIFIGGPVQNHQGFILHTPEYKAQSTLLDSHGKIAMTQTLDILNKIAEGAGPQYLKLLIGYAGWTAGQLEEELRQNVWLVAPASNDLIFASQCETLYERAIQSLGISVGQLSGEGGQV